MASKKWADADDGEKNRMVAKVDEWRKASINAINGVEGAGGKLGKFLSENWEEMVNAGISITNSLVQMTNNILQKARDEQSRENEKCHEDEMKRIDDEMQARLYALGLVEAKTVENYEAQLEAAIQSGDELAIYQANQALTKATIEQEYADEKTRIDEELAQKQAELQYQSEMANWKAQKLAAALNAAQAVMSIWAQFPKWDGGASMYIALGALIGTTIAQMAVIESNRPVRRFETGGIVPGSSYSGDHMMIRANSGEAVITQEQQRNMMNMLNTPGQAAAVNATIIIQLDAREIGRQTFKLAGDGQYFLKARAVH
jgi:hypothetical protein